MTDSVSLKKIQFIEYLQNYDKRFINKSGIRIQIEHAYHRYCLNLLGWYNVHVDSARRRPTGRLYSAFLLNGQPSSIMIHSGVNTLSNQIGPWMHMPRWTELQFSLNSLALIFIPVALFVIKLGLMNFGSKKSHTWNPRASWYPYTNVNSPS